MLWLEAVGTEEANGEGLFSAHDVRLRDVLAVGLTAGRCADAGDQGPGEVSERGERSLEYLYAGGQFFEAGGCELVRDIAQALLRGDHAGGDDGGGVRRGSRMLYRMAASMSCELKSLRGRRGSWGRCRVRRSRCRATR